MDVPMTVDDLYSMPEDGRKYELQAGLLVSEPLPGFRHGRVAAAVAELLRSHVRSRSLGVVLTCDTGFVLARAPDTVRGPDVAFVSPERLPEAGEDAGAFEGAPDLAVEVVSVHDHAADVRAKVADYLAAGTRLVWVIDPDPDRQTVTVYRSLLAPTILGREEQLDGEDVVPGFRVDVAQLFDS
jgi:Uma2 family endonuclease